MRSSNTFGVAFILRNRVVDSKQSVYARITVNKTRCELSLKQYLLKKDWNERKGLAKTSTEEFRQFNSYLEEVRGKLARYYRELLMQEKQVTAEAVKDAYSGKIEQQKNYTLLWLVKEHNTLMTAVLKKGSMKNYFTTERYLNQFLKKKYHKGDLF